jgi:hypothetical protein
MPVAPVLDHVVVNARGEFDAAAEAYLRLGFALTPLGRHTLGSINRLAVFGTDYLEIVGIDPLAAAPRPELLTSPTGLNALVFATDDAAGLFRTLCETGAPVEPPIAFARAVALPEGDGEARFRVVRVAASATPYGRVYFCQHLTPELVWRPEWRDHPNGALSVARLVIAAADPEAASGLYRRLFGAGSVTAVPGGVMLALRAARIDLFTPERVAAEFGEGRDGDGMAALTLKTRSLAQTRWALAAGGVPPLRDEPDRVVVPAAAAFGAMLEFVE